MTGPFTRRGADLLVAVRLTPRASREGIDGEVGLSDGRRVLACRVRAVAEAGRANAALEALLASIAGLPKSAASVETGHTARLKTVRLANAPADAEQRLNPGDAA